MITSTGLLEAPQGIRRGELMSDEQPEWWVFRELKTRFGFGTRAVADRYLSFLNRNRAINHYRLYRLNEVFPMPTIADVERSPDRVDMEADMAGWRG